VAVLIQVRLFAVLRDRAGIDRLTLDLPDGARVGDALARCADLAGDVPVVMAVNREYAKPDAPLHAGDELALIPPVSGGQGALTHVRVTPEPLSSDCLTTLVGDPRAGAIVAFAGVTREVGRLDYEAYVEMAQERITEIVHAAVQRHGLCAAAAEHRVGQVGLGEPSVVVAVSAPHRPEAFAGAREIIDQIKAQAPIWKREDGADWVEGSPPGAD
jgi:molybdopterin converting factor subunit 1